MTIFLEDFDVLSLIEEVRSTVGPLVAKNHNTFTVDYPPDVGTMHADLVKTKQVLFNVLSNAAKFTSNGAVTLTVESGEDSVRFAVMDTGIGMTDEQLTHLFEAFSQADAATTRTYGGTGLGLALSQEFCHMMGGEITVATAPGVGSTFIVTLPRHVTLDDKHDQHEPRTTADPDTTR